MREAEIAMRDEVYKPVKPLPKFSRITIYVLVAVLLIFTLITRSKTILFFFLTLTSLIINYETNITTIRFNPQPEVFSSLIITKVIGFEYALAMLIVPTLIIDIYTARLDKDTFISILLTIFISFIMDKVMLFGFVFFAIILVSVKFIIGLLLNLAIDISPQEILFEHVLGFVVNVILFLAFGGIFFSFFYTA